jgi:PAS domain S-box-containing protein
VIDARTRTPLYVSSAFERIWHRSIQAGTGSRYGLYDWIHPEDRQAARKALDALFEKGMLLNATYRVQDGYGRQRWVHDRGWPVRAGGRIYAAVGIMSDITSEKIAQERQSLLLREMNHRVKNALAIVLSIAHQTATSATSLDDFLQSYYARVPAFSGAHDLLMQNAWTSISLEEVLLRTLAHHIQAAPGRIRIKGPAVLLPHDPSIAFNLVFHELATNAAKYGSLSGPGGHISVTWSLETSDGVEMLDLRWVESGGPPVAAGPRRGFGSRLIKRTLAALGGRAEMNFAPSGFDCWIAAPLEKRTEECVPQFG